MCVKLSFFAPEPRLRMRNSPITYIKMPAAPYTFVPGQVYVIVKSIYVKKFYLKNKKYLRASCLSRRLRSPTLQTPSSEPLRPSEEN